ncbi:hypothetical protein RvY_15740 [Ramazzottius varieornatus]|uniref:Small ribosomal subunit protein mS29 n=1 Tax=Ramazzottius varieornatus TaxID=947166 RepID=A0A1D1VVZ6_RAMVA|nr:hypothetical protein RvY_15740 [Ramazzottius varieornatus]
MRSSVSWLRLRNTLTGLTKIHVSTSSRRWIFSSGCAYQQAQPNSQNPVFFDHRPAQLSVTPLVDTSVPAHLPVVNAKRTTITRPREHTLDHEGFYYCVPPEQSDVIYGMSPNSGAFDMRHRTLQNLRFQWELAKESAIMIRKPALEVMEYVKNTNFAHPVVRYVIYGREGSGRTCTLTHLLHFFKDEGFILLHVPKISIWSRRYKEVQESKFKPGRIDLPLDSVEWLQHFLLQNGEHLRQPNTKLVTHKTYVWSKREETPAGSPLSDIIDVGIKRARYANDCIGVLVEELKRIVSESDHRVAVVMDVANALFTPTTIPQVDKTTVPADRLSLFLHFRKTLKNDWKNGVVVTTIDRKGIVDLPLRFDGGGNQFPRYLLREEGWAVMDPFIPVLVNDYSDKELTNCIDYNIETRWLQHVNAGTQKGRDELKVVSQNNPETLRKLMSRL